MDINRSDVVCLARQDGDIRFLSTGNDFSAAGHFQNDKHPVESHGDIVERSLAGGAVE